MMRDIRKHCYGADGKPDFEMMVKFLECHHRGSRLDGIGWALFFIWVGIAWMFDLGLGAGLLGVATITLGMQAVRRLSGLEVELFWIVVGLGFAVGGFWEWFEVQTPLAAVIIVIAGIALLISVIRSGRRSSRHQSNMHHHDE